MQFGDKISSFCHSPTNIHTLSSISGFCVCVYVRVCACVCVYVCVRVCVCVSVFTSCTRVSVGVILSVSMCESDGASVCL